MHFNVRKLLLAACIALFNIYYTTSFAIKPLILFPAKCKVPEVFTAPTSTSDNIGSTGFYALCPYSGTNTDTSMGSGSTTLQTIGPTETFATCYAQHIAVLDNAVYYPCYNGGAAITLVQYFPITGVKTNLAAPATCLSVINTVLDATNSILYVVCKTIAMHDPAYVTGTGNVEIYSVDLTTYTGWSAVIRSYANCPQTITRTSLLIDVTPQGLYTSCSYVGAGTDPNGVHKTSDGTVIVPGNVCLNPTAMVYGNSALYIACNNDLGLIRYTFATSSYTVVHDRSVYTFYKLIASPSTVFGASWTLTYSTATILEITTTGTHVLSTEDCIGEPKAMTYQARRLLVSCADYGTVLLRGYTATQYSMTGLTNGAIRTGMASDGTMRSAYTLAGQYTIFATLTGPTKSSSTITNAICQNSAPLSIRNGELFLSCFDNGANIPKRYLTSLNTVATAAECTNPTNSFVDANNVIHILCTSTIIVVAADNTVTIFVTPSLVNFAYRSATEYYVMYLDTGKHKVAVMDSATQALSQITTGLACSGFPRMADSSIANMVYYSCKDTTNPGIYRSFSGFEGIVQACASPGDIIIRKEVLTPTAFVEDRIYFICDNNVYINRGPAQSFVTIASCPSTFGKASLTYSDSLIMFACGAYTTVIGESYKCPIGRYWKDNNCDECSLGKYSDFNTAVRTCVACTAGKVASLLGSTACSTCTAGKYASADGTSCLSCSLGQFSNAGDASCTNCVAGKFAATEASGSCATCSDGKYASASFSTCVECSAGSYSTPADVTKCTLCVPGKYSLAGGQSYCNDCAAGYWCNGGSRILCSSVDTFCPANAPGPVVTPAGYYSTGCTGNSCTSNTQCPIDSYCVGGIRAPCSSGFIAIAGQASCTACSFGKYATIGACTDCLPGTYQNITAKTFCTTCANGTVTSSAGKSECETCSIGKFSSSNRTQCIECSPGKYQNLQGQTFCFNCALGYVSNSTSSVCVACPAGRYMISNNTCIACQNRTFQSLEAQTYCFDCTRATGIGNLVCPNVTLNASIEEILGVDSRSSIRQIMVSLSDVTRTTSIASTVFDAATEVIALSCEKGEKYNFTTGSCDKCSIGTYNTGGIGCLASPIGTFTPEEGTGEPLLCPESDGVYCIEGRLHSKENYWISSDIPAKPRSGENILYTYGNVTIIVERCRDNMCVGNFLDENQCVEGREGVICGDCSFGYVLLNENCAPCSGSNGGLIISCFLLIVAYVFCVYYILKDERGVAPLAITMYFIQLGLTAISAEKRSFSAWFSIFNFSPHYIMQSCMFPIDSYEAAPLDMSIALLYFIALGLVYYVEKLVYAMNGWQHIQVKHLLRTYVFVYTSFYSQIVEVTVKYMICVEVDDERVLFWTPAIKCNDERYKGILAIAVILFTLFGLLCPILLFVVAARSGKSALFGGLRRTAQYFEFIVLFSRLMTSITTSIAFDDEDINSLIHTFINAVYFVVTTVLEPYESFLHNLIANTTAGILTVLGITSTFEGTLNNAWAIGSIISILYITPAILLFVYTFMERVPCIREKLRRFNFWLEHENDLTVIDQERDKQSSVEMSEPEKKKAVTESEEEEKKCKAYVAAPTTPSKVPDTSSQPGTPSTPESLDISQSSLSSSPITPTAELTPLRKHHHERITSVASVTLNPVEEKDEMSTIAETLTAPDESLTSTGIIVTIATE